MLCFSRELQAEIWSRRFFFLLNLCRTQISKWLTCQSGADDFQHLIWIFWVSQLSPMWYNIDCSQLMYRCNPYRLQRIYPTVKHCWTRNLSMTLHKPLLTCSISHSTFSIHCTDLFLCLSWIFLNIRNTLAAENRAPPLLWSRGFSGQGCSPVLEF